LKAVVLVVNRTIKIFANTLKLLCYLFHFVFPKKRFTLPSKSPAWRSTPPSVIPRIIWQTNYTNEVTLPVYLNYLFNRLMAPSFEYRYVSTEERAQFVKKNYPKEIFDSYSKLQIGAAQADFWRVLNLEKHGGIYLDIDAHFVWPLSYNLPRNSDELFVTSTKGNITNYFIASKPNNPRLQAIIKTINENISTGDIKNVYYLTGPGVFVKVLDASTIEKKSYRYVCSQGNFTNEYFQYVDKPQGKWTKEQQTTDIVRRSL